MASADEPDSEATNDSPGGKDASAGPASALKAATAEITAAFERLANAWPGADSESESPPEPAPDLAARARKKYDATVRWAVGAFSAIGALIFGSLPFVELADANPWMVAAGLLLAAIGLGTVIWATTHALEPEDASLGELAQTLNRIGTIERPPRQWMFWQARTRAAWELNRILAGDESEAHLGPGVGSVAELINRLGDLDRRVLADEVGWDGQNSPPTAPGGWRGSVVARKSLEDGARTEMTAIAATLEELRKHDEPASAPGRNQSPSRTVRLPNRRILVAPGRDAIGKLESSYRALIDLLPDKSELLKRGEARAKSAAHDRYLQHRHGVLQVSLVSQMRGTFRQARGYLVVGAVLTLVGGALYAYAVANPSQKLNGTPVIATVLAETARDALDGCLGDDVSGEYVVLQGVVTDEDAESFVLAITKGDCAGSGLKVDEGVGSYAATPDAVATPAATGTATPTPTPTPTPTDQPAPTASDGATPTATP